MILFLRLTLVVQVECRQLNFSITLEKNSLDEKINCHYSWFAWFDRRKTWIYYTNMAKEQLWFANVIYRTLKLLQGVTLDELKFKYCNSTFM